MAAAGEGGLCPYANPTSNAPPGPSAPAPKPEASRRRLGVLSFYALAGRALRLWLRGHRLSGSRFNRPLDAGRLGLQRVLALAAHRLQPPAVAGLAAGLGHLAAVSVLFVGGRPPGGFADHKPDAAGLQRAAELRAPHPDPARPAAHLPQRGGVHGLSGGFAFPLCLVVKPHAGQAQKPLGRFLPNSGLSAAAHGFLHSARRLGLWRPAALLVQPAAHRPAPHRPEIRCAAPGALPGRRTCGRRPASGSSGGAFQPAGCLLGIPAGVLFPARSGQPAAPGSNGGIRPFLRPARGPGQRQQPGGPKPYGQPQLFRQNHAAR